MVMMGLRPSFLRFLREEPLAPAINGASPAGSVVGCDKGASGFMGDAVGAFSAAAELVDWPFMVAVGGFQRKKEDRYRRVYLE